MLGTALFDELKNRHNLFLTGTQNQSVVKFHNYLKFDLSSQSYKELIDWSKPDIVIHCAAIVDGTLCEKKPQLAFEINSYSVLKFIEFLPETTKFIYISSDAVFPNYLNYPTENDFTNSNNIYGKSKELGEYFILNSSMDYTIVRTTLVGFNFYKENNSLAEWIIDSVRKSKNITLFDDVKFTPISIWDFAGLIELVLGTNYRKSKLHICGSEVSTKYEFGIKLLNAIHLSTDYVIKESINNFKLNSNRSNDQSLNSNFFEKAENILLPNLEKTIISLKNNYLKSVFIP